MHSFCFSIIQKNKFVFVILIFLFSLLSIYMPQGIFDAHEQHEVENLFRHVTNNNRPATILRKLLEKLRSFLLKIFKLPQILSKTIILVNIRLVLFNKLISKGLILNLFSVLCFYFHGGKYKQSFKHDEALLLMAV